MNKVLFVTNDVIGDAAAGPGIRYLELGKELSRKGYAVTVMGRMPAFSSPQPFTFQSLTAGNLIRGMRSHDCVIFRGGGPLTTLIILLFGSHADVVSDYYAFTHFEVPHLAPASFADRCVVEFRKLFHSLKLDLHSRHLNKFWVAHERQRSFLQGLFFAKGIRSAKEIDLVPFGCPAERPTKKMRRLRGVLEGIDNDDFLLVWGGGVWDWLDPITLVKAMALLREQDRKIKLYFLGVRAPSGYIPEKGREMIDLATNLGLLGRNVFVNEGWTPYVDRIDFLLEADAGVSLHPPSLETFYSFRTRNLDYVYCSLPMIHTEGDVWADLIRRHGLGIVVPPGDHRAVADAILRLCSDKALLLRLREALNDFIHHFTWDSIAAEAVRSIEARAEAQRHCLLPCWVDVILRYTLFGARCLIVLPAALVRRNKLRSRQASDRR
jgi:hypothetical protein